MDALSAAFARYGRHGDVEALGRVFDAVSPRLLALALHLTGNAADAEDALQATFVVAMKKADTFDARQPVEPWLCGMLAGEANNLRRRQQRRRSEPLPEAAAAAGSDEVENRELVAQLRTHIDRLPVEQRQVLLLQLQHGLQPAEIAEVLGLAPGTVRMRIHRGLASLKRALPAGLVAGALLLFPERGLAAVRQAVMQAGVAEAATASGTASWLATTIGGLLMKKVATALAAALALACAWWWWQLAGTTTAPTPPHAEHMPAAAAADLRDAPATDAPAPGDGRATTREVVAERSGSLWVELRADEVTRVNAFEAMATSTAGSGAAMTGARIEAWPGTLDDPHGATGLRHGHTDDDGALVLDDLQPGPWRVAALAGGVRVAGPTAVQVRGGEQARLELHLALGGRVRGRVVDIAGRPVGGAEIRVGTRLGYHAPSHTVRVAARAAADGSFAFAHTKGEEYVGARMPGYQASWSHPLHQLGDGDVELTLLPDGGSVRGVVVDDDGRAMAAVPVAIEPTFDRLQRTAGGALVGPRLAVVVTTDERGGFVVDGLPPGRVRCRADRLPWRHAERSVAVPNGGVADVRLELLRRATVRGSLRAPNGSPQSRVYVSLLQGGSSQTAISRADGSFVFEGVGFAPFRLTAARINAVARVERDFPAPREQTTEIDLVLDEGLAVRGTASTRSGLALVGWPVVVTCGDLERRTVVGDDGTFVLRGFSARSCELVLQRAQDDDRFLRALTVTPGRPVAIVVPDEAVPVGGLRGRFVDDRGAPLPQTNAMLQHDALEQLTIDEHGVFAIDGLRCGKVELRYSADDRIARSRNFEVEAGRRRDLGDLVLQRGGTVRVRFQRSDGTAWPGRPPMPWLRNGNGWLTAGHVDYAIDGDEVVITRVPPGRCEVQGPPGDELLVEPTAIDVLAGDVQRLTMGARLARRRRLEFDGRGVDGKLHATVRGAGFERSQVIGPDPQRSRWTLLLPVGRLQIEARAEDGTRYAREYVVEPGLEQPYRVAVPRVAR